VAFQTPVLTQRLLLLDAPLFAGQPCFPYFSLPIFCLWSQVSCLPWLFFAFHLLSHPCYFAGGDCRRYTVFFPGHCCVLPIQFFCNSEIFFQSGRCSVRFLSHQTARSPRRFSRLLHFSVFRMHLSPLTPVRTFFPPLSLRESERFPQQPRVWPEVRLRAIPRRKSPILTFAFWLERLRDGLVDTCDRTPLPFYPFFDPFPHPAFPLKRLFLFFHKDPP